MSFYNIISENFILPVSDFVLKRNIKSQLDFINKSQWWTKRKLKEYQLKKLTQILEHCYKNVPFYRKRFDENGIKPFDIKDFGDLKKIPPLTKDDIINNYSTTLKASNINYKSCYLTPSSGSTGKQVHYYIDRNAYGMNIACNLRGWYWMGYRIGDRFVKISQNKRSNIIKKLQDTIDRCNLHSLKYNEKNFYHFVYNINKTNPDFIRSYPDPLEFISNYIKDNGIEIIPIKAINTTGNILFDEKRNLIEEVFNTKVFDSYSTEGTATLFECPTHKCYHLAMEYGIYEITDNSSQAGGNLTGQLYATDLWNYATPFIRYETKDVLIKSNNECSCGRGLETYKKIVGRNNDVLVSPSGNYMIAQTFTTYFKYINSVKQFKVSQISQNEFVFTLVTDDLFNDSIKDQIIAYWLSYMGEKVKIKVEVVKSIPTLPSGKLQFVERAETVPINNTN